MLVHRRISRRGELGTRDGHLRHERRRPHAASGQRTCLFRAVVARRRPAARHVGVARNRPGMSDKDDGVWITNSSKEVTDVMAMATTARVEYVGGDESGEIAARERWHAIRSRKKPIVTRHHAATARKLALERRTHHIMLLACTVVGTIVWRVTAILLSSTDLPIAAGILVGV